MAYLYYSTWLLAEQLRLFSDLALEGCRWWNWPPGGSGSSAPQAPACGSAPPPAYFERLVGIAERIVGHEEKYRKRIEGGWRKRKKECPKKAESYNG